jgi:hypothetical protein
MFAADRDPADADQSVGIQGHSSTLRDHHGESVACDPARLLLVEDLAFVQPLNPGLVRRQEYIRRRSVGGLRGKARRGIEREPNPSPGGLLPSVSDWWQHICETRCGENENLICLTASRYRGNA